MANEYDDLLESFMNNSAKVYDEDKKSLENKPNKKPAAYIESDKASKQSVQRSRGKKPSKRSNSGVAVKSKAPASLAGRIILGILLVILVVGYNDLRLQLCSRRSGF